MNAVPRVSPDPLETSGRSRIVLVEFLPSGGLFQFSFQFAAALADAGHEVTLVTGPDPELTSRTDGLQVRSLLPTWHPNAVAAEGIGRRLRRLARAVRLLESWRRVLVLLRRERPDVAQFGELRFALDSAAFLAVARLTRPTAIVDVAHNPLPYDVTGKADSAEKGGWLTRRLLRRRTRPARWCWCWARGLGATCSATFLPSGGSRSAATATTPRCSSR